MFLNENGHCKKKDTNKKDNGRFTTLKKEIRKSLFPHSSYLRTFYLEIKICAWLYGTKDLISIGLPYK